MDSVSYEGIDLLLIASCPGARRWQRWVRVPGGVGEAELDGHVHHWLGANEDRDSPRPVRAVGDSWEFPTVGLHLEGLPPAAGTLVVIPHVRFESGRRVRLSEYRGWLATVFSAMVGSDVPTESPNELRGRLDSEQLELIRGDIDVIEIQLRGWLQRMIDDGRTYLTVVLGERGRYVQFMVDCRRRLIAEAVSSEHLEAHQDLTPDEQRELLELGWNPPRPDNAENYWMEWDLDRRSPAESHPSRCTLPGADRAVRTEVFHAARLGAATIAAVFAPDTAHRATVEVGRIHIDAR